MMKMMMIIIMVIIIIIIIIKIIIKIIIIIIKIIIKIIIITEVTNEQQENMFLFQRISVALKRGNAIAFRNTFPSEH